MELARLGTPSPLSCRIRTPVAKLLAAPTGARSQGARRLVGGAGRAGFQRRVARGSTGRWWALRRGRAGVGGVKHRKRGEGRSQPPGGLAADGRATWVGLAGVRRGPGLREQDMRWIFRAATQTWRCHIMNWVQGGDLITEEKQRQE